MAIGARLIKGAIGAVLLNQTARSALIAALLRSAKYITRPSTISRVKSFFDRLGRSAAGRGGSDLLSKLFEGAAELLLLKFAKKGGLFGPGLFSVLAAILLAMRRGCREGTARRPDQAGKIEQDRVIDLDEYTILDENH